jgi:hypothetical protein
MQNGGLGIVEGTFTDNGTVKRNVMIAQNKLNLWNVLSIIVIRRRKEVTHYWPVAVVELQFSLSACGVK